MNASPFPTERHPDSILDTLAAWREIAPAKVALRVLRDGEQVEREATYRELHDQAMEIAAALRSRWPRGTRVMLLLPTGVEFVVAFYGCLAAGMVAVPAHHPQQPKKVAQWQKLDGIVGNCGAALIVAPARSLDVLPAMKAEAGLFGGCDVETFDALLAAAGRLAAGDAARTPTPPSRADLAFLQYTSGSTGSPKGVMLTHGNVLANQEVIAALMGHHRETRVVSWLPLYHDMGLSAVLQMASVGASITLMSPVDFITRPLRWLHAISRQRAHTSGGPNFAYQLVAQALRAPDADLQGLDLSSWELAFCGAEPIHRGTVTEFLEAAAPHGFAPGAFHACYGMAEATVQVTGAAKGQGVRFLEVSQAQLSHGRIERCAPQAADMKSLVACGATRPGHELRIVDAQGRALPDGQVGEIWVRGASIGAGYWGNDEATQATFGARLDGDAGAPFLRTGDLGAVVDGELYVTGRVKDMLIVRGRNLYPQDVEDCVQDAVPELRRGCGAAIAVTVGHEDKLVIVQEIGRTQRRQMDFAAAFGRIVGAVGDDFGVLPHQVILVEPATIEKTSSGKIARALCRRAFLQGQLRVVAAWTEGELADAPAAAPASAPGGAAGLAIAARQRIEQRIAQVAAEFLKVDPQRVSRTTPWTELGFDSVSALQLAMKVEQAIGTRLDPTVLWNCANIEELAAHLATTGAELREDPPAPVAPAPLAPTAGSLDAERVLALSDEEAEALLLKELER